MKWHTNETRLWLKSSAMMLFRIVSVDTIRDEIMQWPGPAEVVQFVIASGILFNEKDMIKYMSMLKYIIPDGKWLLSKMEKVYTFTVVSPELSNIIGANTHVDARTDPTTKMILDKRVSSCSTAALIVTKD